MTVYSIDPLQDRRWEEFLQTHPHASIFHTTGWLEALRRTYGYQPVLFTTSPSTGELANGIAFCRIKSFLTGSRLVSLPFADHCRPLASANEFGELVRHLQPCSLQGYKYIELRGVGSTPQDVESSSGFTLSESFVFHQLDLAPTLEVLFRGLHPSCVQRKIRRADREGLAYEEGGSDELLDHFYSLLVLTRRRHGLPPQPLSWFRNLRDCFGDAFKVRVASKGDRPIASILTLRHKSTLVYKYGCSDARFHSLGAMPLLFWRAIEDGKVLGLHQLDLGRSDANDLGLITFKEHLGASASALHYYRYPKQFATDRLLRKMMPTPKVCSYVPDLLLKAAGNFLYRHIG